MPHQLTFDLPARAALGRDDFFISASNALALASLEDWANWPSGKLVLAGPKGAGKTHLAHVWAADVNAAIIDARDLARADIAALAAHRYVVVEDADRLPNAASEEALFHLHNLTLAEGGRLLITATEAPARWNIALPDLASRMQGTTLARIDPPDDPLLKAMLLKLFTDRQIAIPPRLIDYLVPRMERSHAAAAALVEALDHASLAARKPINTAMASALLDNSPPKADT
ncbi:MAG: chromosomal replication initiator DnaA [Paracoccaceae bacterium]